jgi:transcriptional regulator with XRE-family HTH domain
MDPFLDFLKALRERAGLTQIELSYKAGLSETYYGKIESGERRPSPRVVLELLHALAATTLEEQQAIRLFAESRLPSVFLERLAPRPLMGTVTPVAAPSISRKRRRRLAALVFALLTPWGSPSPLGLPVGSEGARVPLIGRWGRRYFGEVSAARA